MVREFDHGSTGGSSGPVGATARDNATFDRLDLLLRNHAGPRALRGLPWLVRDALGRVRQASRQLTAATLALSVLAAVLTVAQVLVALAVLHRLLGGGPQVRVGAALPLVLVLVGLAALSLVVGTVLGLLRRLLGELVVRDTESRMLEVTAAVPLGVHDTPWFANFVVRVETNALRRPAEMVQAVANLVGGGLATAGLTIVLTVIEPLLLPALAVTAVPVFLANRRAGRLEYEFAVAQASALRDRLYLARVLKDRATAKEVRAYELGDVLRARWADQYDRYVAGLRALVRDRVLLAAGGSLGSGVALAAGLALLLYRVQSGAVTLSEAAVAVVVIRMLATRLQAVAAGASQLFATRLFLEDLRTFLALPDVVGAGPGRPAAADAPFEEVSVEQACFTYPGADRPALTDVSLTLARGEVVALVGENGSGKTTLATLLAGLHEPTTGSVRWDGVPATEAGATGRVAVVFQDFARYELSARDNVALGRADRPADPARIRAAALAAGVDDILDALPGGYDCVLSTSVDGGTDLSVGQWQRVALARALYRDAALVVLDEPTSALDPRAEHELYSRMRTVFAGRTVVLISHRFSSVRSADRIHVLHGGRIVESGDHDTLMASGGRYAEMFTLQASAYLAG